MYLLLLAVIYLAFISLGLPDSLLGAAWPTLHAILDIPISYMGFISMIISGGTIISSLFTARLTNKFGTRIITAASILLTALALFGFSISKEFYLLCLFAIPYGFGAGAIDASLNNYVAKHYNSRHMSWLHCFWGVGAIISPYIMSFALTHSTWNQGYRAVSFIQIAIFIVVLLSFPLWKKKSKGGQDEKSEKALRLGDAIRIPSVLSLLIGFLAYCAAEATAMLWASSYFEAIFSSSKEEAAAFGSLFFIGITCGRFASGFIAERLGDGRMIRLGTLIAFVGIALICVPLKPVAVSGFVLLGLGCAPIYPSIIHSTPTSFGEENSGSIIGIQMASAYVGSTFMPPLFGVLSSVSSLRIMPIYLAFFLILMTILITNSQKACKKS